MSDTRLRMARHAHDLSREREQHAVQYRQQRDRYIREIWASDRAAWTYEKLAKAIGCSPELIAHIVKKDTTG